MPNFTFYARAALHAAGALGQRLARQCASWLVFDAFVDAFYYAWLVQTDTRMCSCLGGNMNRNTMFQTDKDWTG